MTIRVSGTSSASFALLSCLGFLPSCTCEKTPPAPSAPAVLSANAPPAAPSAPKILGERRLMGPRQLVVPGKGITAILFGATVPTIERHMQAPCDLVTETRCLYIDQAVDFTLDQGKMVRAKVYLRDRAVPGVPDRAFGTFHGGMAPSIMLGLHRHVVQQEFGAPLRSETIAPAEPVGLVAKDFYEGLTLEYDKLDNGNTVLAAIEVYPAASTK